jgi:hypothetical protein
MDGRGRWMDNVFIERLWRSMKYECVYLHAFETGSELRAGLAKWVSYYNAERPHSGLGGRTKILPPADYLPSEDQTQDPHILRAIGRAWGWRRRMEAGEFATVRDLAIAMDLAERHVSRQLRLAYLAPDVLRRLVFCREVTAVTVMQLTECAALPWGEQAGVMFELQT